MLAMSLNGPSRFKGTAAFAAAALFAACATGVEPDRSSLNAGTGGSIAGSGAGGDSVGSVSASSSTTGPGPGASSSSAGGGAMASSSSAESSSAASTSGGGGMGGAGGSGTGGSGTGGAPVGLHLQYKAADTNANDNQIKPEFIIVNDGQVSVPLSELSIRYWFTNDGGQMNFFCDFAVVGCATVSGSFSAAAGVNTDTALEVTFSSATMIGPGMTSGEVKTRLHKADFELLNETNDYSFDPTKTNYTDWTQVGLYHNGVLVWGVEP